MDSHVAMRMRVKTESMRVSLVSTYTLHFMLSSSSLIEETWTTFHTDNLAALKDHSPFMCLSSLRVIAVRCRSAVRPSVRRPTVRSCRRRSRSAVSTKGDKEQQAAAAARPPVGPSVKLPGGSRLFRGRSEDVLRTRRRPPG